MSKFAVEDIVYELNERAAAYARNDMSIEDAIQRAVEDWVPYLEGSGYRILSVEEIRLNGSTKFFEPYGEVSSNADLRPFS